MFDYLKENVKMDMKAPGKTRADFIEEDNVYLIKDAGGNDISHSIELLVMLLSNVSITEDGQKHVLGEGKTKGAILGKFS